MSKEIQFNPLTDEEKIERLEGYVDYLKSEKNRLIGIIEDEERQINRNLDIRLRAELEVKEILECAKESDSDNVNLIDRLEMILEVLKDE